MIDRDADVCYNVENCFGVSAFSSLHQLEEYLATEHTSARTPIRRIVRVTREDIDLPDFVEDYNSKCKKHKEN